jgi:hypothetical protein
MNWSQFVIHTIADAPDMSAYAGTAYLYINGLILIPTEGLYWGGRHRGDIYNFDYDTFTWAKNAQAAATSGTVAYYGYIGPNEKQDSIIYGTASIPIANGVGEPFYKNGIPPGTNGIGILAFDSHVSQGTAWTANMQLMTAERWESMRGNE